MEKNTKINLFVNRCIIGGILLLIYSCQQAIEKASCQFDGQHGKEQFINPTNIKNLFIKEYDNNSNLLRSYETLDSTKNGLQIDFSDNGQISTVEQFKKNKRDGYYSEFYPTGELALVGRTVNGHNDGKFSLFYKNGKLKLQTTLIRGVPVGHNLHYNKEGRLTHYKFFNNTGHLRYDLKYGENGKAYKKEGVLVIFDENKEKNEVLVSTIKPPNCQIEKLKIIKKNDSNKILDTYELADTSGMVIALCTDTKTTFDIFVRLSGDFTSKQEFSLTF